jgi:hypothetical protein
VRELTDAAVVFPAPSDSVSFHWASIVGDLNGDGYADLAIGDPEYNSGQGRIFCYY